MDPATSVPTSTAMIRRRRESTPLTVWVLMAAMMLITASWSLLTPPLMAPDETAHFSSSIRLSEGFSWPAPGEARMPGFVEVLGEERNVTPEERSTFAELRQSYPGESERLDQMTQHPPLYYLLTGSVLKLMGGDDARWDQALLSIRLLGGLAGAAVVWLAWSTVRRLTESRLTGQVAAMAIFLAPGFAQMLGVANNDTLAILIGAVLTWLAVKILCGDRTWPVLVATGATFGLAGLVKGTLIVYGPLLLLVLLFGANRPDGWPRRLWQTAWPFLIAFAAGQWWWLRNLILVGTLQPYGYLLSDSTWPPGEGPSLFDFVDEFWRVMPATFWGWFGRVNAPLPRILVDFLAVTCIVLVVVGVFRFRRDITRALIIAIPVVVSAILMLRVSWGAYAETTDFRGMHGRYFYAVLLPLVALGAIAMRNLVRDRSARIVFGVGLAAASTFMAVFGMAVSYIYFYAGDLWAQWRTGIDAWVNQMSPAPGPLNLVVIVLAVAALGAGAVLLTRDILRDHPPAIARSPEDVMGASSR